jgi:erythromycin esterase-like protein
MNGAGKTAVVALLCAPLIHPADSVTVDAKVAWLAEHAVAIRSLNPRDKDCEDLRPLAKSIGNARIVLLGGSDSEATVKAKYRMVRFLHEQMGFDVLTSFAPVFDAAEFEHALELGKTPRPDLWQLNSLPFRFRQPGNPDGTVDVVYYAESTHKAGRPLHIAGFGRAVTPYMMTEYIRQLSQVLNAIDPSLAAPANLKPIQALITLSSPTPSTAIGSRWRPPGPDQWKKVLPPGIEAITKLYDALGRAPATAGNARDIDYYRQTLANLAYFAAARARRPLPYPPRDPVVALAQVWRPDSKIIVWSGNATVGRNLPNPGSPNGAPGFAVQTTGNAVAQAFGTACYSIAFREIKNDAAVLQVLAAGPEPKLQPVESDLESLLHAAGKPTTFIDFRSLPEDHWLRKPLSARFTLGAEISTWPDHYDGLFTIDQAILKDLKDKK